MDEFIKLLKLTNGSVRIWLGTPNLYFRLAGKEAHPTKEQLNYYNIWFKDEKTILDGGPARRILVGELEELFPLVGHLAPINLVKVLYRESGSEIVNLVEDDKIEKHFRIERDEVNGE